jgi:hypothetical protein
MSGLSRRAQECLRRGNYRSRNEVMLATTKSLLLIRGTGLNTIRELNGWRTPRTVAECAMVIRWISENKSEFSLTAEAAEILSFLLPTDPNDGLSDQHMAEVLSVIYPLRAG